MPAEPPPESAPGRAARGAAPGPRRAPPDPQEVAAAERRVNSPTPLTLRLLGVICVATVLPWMAAKIACNQRDSPVRQPHDLPTEVLAKNAKSAALELAQRAASGRYREAAELARGDVAKELSDADARCATEPAPCEQRRAQSEHVFTRAVVASRGPLEATVRTESRVGQAAPERFAMRLQHDDGRWYVVRRTPLDGPIDAPVAPDEMVSPIAIREVPAGQAHGNLSVTLSPHSGAPHGSAPSSGTANENASAPDGEDDAPAQQP